MSQQERETGIRRTGVSLPACLLRQLDELMRETGLRSRSRVIAEALRLYLGERSWLRAQGALTGALVILYDHQEHETAQEATEVEHEYRDVILSTVHVHLSERICLEVLVVKGQASRIRELTSHLEGLPGIRVIRCALVPLEPDLDLE